MQALKILNSRYQLLTVIKRGGFGTIYKGHDSVLAKEIAVKEINRDLVQDAWYIEQFQKEARHVAKMNHQNIVHIFDMVHTDDGQFYIVMEYIDGLDLSSLIKHARATGDDLPQHLAVHVVGEICKALDYAHNCSSSESHEPLNLVHQDISPSNIMISRSGAVKLIDFGIAGTQKRTAADKEALTLQGKVQYMSPEHVDAERQIDRRSDIFSLGLVLYELLEGTRFFHLEDQHAIIETLRNGRLKVKFNHTPKPIQQVIQKALEKDLDKRYQNANQLYIDLVTFLVLNSDTSSIDAALSKFIALLVEPKQEQEPPELPADFAPAGEDELIAAVLGGQTKPAEEAAKPAEPDVSAEPQKEQPRAATEPVQTMALTVTRPPEQPSGDDEIKTVIDVVRLATRGNGKRLKRMILATAGLAVVFLAFDVIFQWTRVGAGVYDFILPPAIRINSIPAGATVLLNNEPIAGTTPLAIDEIKPGVYELKLELPPFAPIVKSLQVPGTGQVKVIDAGERSGGKPYTFRFRTELQIDSEPPGAEVFINDTKFGGKTPCSVTWEIGERCEIRLESEGFGELAGFALTAEDFVEEIDDRRVWDFEKILEPELQYRINGRFGLYLAISSNPPGAEIYLDKSSKPVGVTGGRPFFLSADKHEIILKKDGYNTKRMRLTVSDRTPETLSAVLTRKVRFSAFDATNGKDKDLGAELVKLTRDNKTILTGKKTPFEVDLAPHQYVATFARAGYADISLPVAPDAREITARLEPTSGRYSVVLLDKRTKEPLSNVEVRLKSLDKPGVQKEQLDISDTEGTVDGQLAPGLYLFRTSKNGYEYQEKSVAITPGKLNLIEFNLSRK